ncbi:hypothetical protein PMIN04_010861 [Paraphaeosphaeria minitans]
MARLSSDSTVAFVTQHVACVDPLLAYLPFAALQCDKHNPTPPASFLIVFFETILCSNHPWNLLSPPQRLDENLQRLIHVNRLISRNIPSLHPQLCRHIVEPTSPLI